MDCYKSRTLSKVVFNGSTYIQFSGNRILLDRFRFENGNAGKNDVISFKSSDEVASFCRITNITIDNYNTPSADGTLKNAWVSLFGVNNRIDHCTVQL